MANVLPNLNVLGLKNAKHLLRRTTYDFSKKTIDQFAALTPAQALDILLAPDSPTLNLPYDPTPEAAPDGFWTESSSLPSSFLNQDRKATMVTAWWWYNAQKSQTLKYKMSHFLSTCFTVQRSNSGTASDFYDYIRLLLFYANGNYKTLAKKITLSNAMLNYLSNGSNSKSSPNENYAREFLELFTIGKGPQIALGNYTNYTESDISQAARVLTGFRTQEDRSLLDAETKIPKGYNLFSQHQTSAKIFSTAFNSRSIPAATNAVLMDTELEAFVTMVFDQPATAKNICRKLYTYFVKSAITPEIENDIIHPLAQNLYAANYELTTTIRLLFESLHFYDLDDSNANDETIGAIIKSPLQQLSEISSSLQLVIPDPTTNPLAFYYQFWCGFINNSFFSSANMTPFNPESVAGHPAIFQAPDHDKLWISASTLIARYRLGESLIEGLNKISGNANIGAKINSIDLLRNSDLISNPTDPYILTSELCNLLFGQEADSDRVNYFMNSFLLQGLDASYWTTAWNNFISSNNSSVIEARIKLLLTKILRAAESQLF